MNKKALAALVLSATVLAAGAASANTMYYKTRPTISGKVVAHGGSRTQQVAHGVGCGVGEVDA